MEDARIMNSVEGLCQEMETVRGFCYLGDRVNGGGGWEAAVTVKRKNWLSQVQGVWGVAELKKVLYKGKMSGLSALCKIGDVTWE